MPRKAFVADLQDAVATFQNPHVSNLKAGEEDGLINFDYQLQDDEDATKITILIPGEYFHKLGFLRLTLWQILASIPARTLS